MTSTTNKPFHTYENVGYDDQPLPSNSNHYVPQQTTTTTTTATTITTNATTTNGSASGINSNATIGSNNTAIAVNKTAIESPFADPMLHVGKLIPLCPRCCPTFISNYTIAYHF